MSFLKVTLMVIAGFDVAVAARRHVAHTGGWSASEACGQLNRLAERPASLCLMHLVYSGLGKRQSYAKLSGPILACETSVSGERGGDRGAEQSAESDDGCRS